MVRVAGERIADLFALAEKEAAGRSPDLADRYVRLARRIGMRYNVRFLPEYSETYCRGCLRYWVEGRTVRTRLRSGGRVRTCLSCGRRRRVPFRRRGRVESDGGVGGRRRSSQGEVGFLGVVSPPGTGTDGVPDREGR